MDTLLTDVTQIPKNKKVIVFDLDDTLTQSKEKMDGEMAGLFAGLLVHHHVAVIGGGNFHQQELQVLNDLPVDARLENLFIMPLNSGAMYQYEAGHWTKVYEKLLSAEQKQEITEAFNRAIKEIGFVSPQKLYGEQLEDRGSQMSFSVLGQSSPLAEKEAWRSAHDVERVKLTTKVQEYLPDMECQVAGITTIDVTQKGIDKAFGIGQIIQVLGVTAEDVLFVGDSFQPNGNDTPALRAGVSCLQVKSPQETKATIQYLLS